MRFGPKFSAPDTTENPRALKTRFDHGRSLWMSYCSESHAFNCHHNFAQRVCTVRMPRVAACSVEGSDGPETCGRKRGRRGRRDYIC
jgi:hypothetical protein